MGLIRSRWLFGSVGGAGGSLVLYEYRVLIGSLDLALNLVGGSLVA